MKITNEIGTDLEFDLRNRFGNSCPGCVEKPGELGSPPDAEVNIAPNEDMTNGIFIVDGSVAIKEIGLVREPIKIEIKDGKIVNYNSNDVNTCKILKRLFNDDKRVAGELGIGMNPNCSLTGNMLTDEGTLGTFHIGFGSNFSIEEQTGYYSI